MNALFVRLGVHLLAAPPSYALLEEAEETPPRRSVGGGAAGLQAPWSALRGWALGRVWRRCRTSAAGLVLLRQVEEQRVQRRPFLVAQRSEELLFDFAGERPQGAERPLSLRGDQHEMTAPILCIAT